VSCIVGSYSITLLLVYIHVLTFVICILGIFFFSHMHLLQLFVSPGLLVSNDLFLLVESLIPVFLALRTTYGNKETGF
jgi:uncharacterized membrane protein